MIVFQIWTVVQEKSNESVRMMLVGNKCDLKGKRAVSKERGQALANKYGMEFCETSAKTAEYVQEAFRVITRKLLIGQYQQFEAHQQALMDVEASSSCSCTIL